MATLGERMELRIQEQLKISEQLKKQKQEEIDCEIESIVKNFLEKHKQFYIVPKFNGCDAVLVFTRWDLKDSRATLNPVSRKGHFKTLSKLKGYTLVYFKNSCPNNTEFISSEPYIFEGRISF